MALDLLPYIPVQIVASPRQRQVTSGKPRKTSQECMRLAEAITVSMFASKQQQVLAHYEEVAFRAKPACAHLATEEDALLGAPQQVDASASKDAVAAEADQPEFDDHYADVDLDQYEDDDYDGLDEYEYGLAWDAKQKDNRLYDLEEAYEEGLLRKSRFGKFSAPLRSKQHNKKEKVNPDRYVKVADAAKDTKYYFHRSQDFAGTKDASRARNSSRIGVPPWFASGSAAAPAGGAAPPSGSRAAPPSASRASPHAATNEERALARALQESRTATAPSGLTYQQIEDLGSRELTPEDYLMLLALDESVQKKTISKTEMKSFKTVEQAEDSEELCAICFSNFARKEQLTVLPCDHHFHDHCISTWLTTSNVTCPLCGLKLKD